MLPWQQHVPSPNPYLLANPTADPYRFVPGSVKFLYYKHDAVANKVASDRAYYEKWGSTTHPACVATFPATAKWDARSVSHSLSV